MRRFLLSLLLGRVRLNVMRWEDRRTLLQKSDADLIERRMRNVMRRPADMHVSSSPYELPAWLERVTENVTILRRQAN